MENIFDISYLISHYGYTGVFIIVFLESGIFFALPGDSLLFSAGIMASSNIVSIFITIPVIFFATFFGSVAGYFMGNNLKRLEKYSFFRKLLDEEKLKKANTFFEHHGKSAMIFSRFIPVIRTFVPIVAGIVKMNEKSFLIWNLIGSFLWSFSMTLLGYFLGEILPNSKEYVHYLIIGVVLISLIPLFWGMISKKIQTK